MNRGAWPLVACGIAVSFVLGFAFAPPWRIWPRDQLEEALAALATFLIFTLPGGLAAVSLAQRRVLLLAAALSSMSLILMSAVLMPVVPALVALYGVAYTRSSPTEPVTVVPFPLALLVPAVLSASAVPAFVFGGRVMLEGPGWGAEMPSVRASASSITASLMAFASGVVLGKERSARDPASEPR